MESSASASRVSGAEAPEATPRRMKAVEPKPQPVKALNGKRQSGVWDAIGQLRLRQDAAERRVDRLRKELAAVRHGLAEVREAQDLADSRGDSLCDGLAAVQQGLVEARETINEMRLLLAAEEAQAADPSPAEPPECAVKETAVATTGNRPAQPAVDELAGLPAKIRVQFEPEPQEAREQLQLSEMRHAGASTPAAETAQRVTPPGFDAENHLEVGPSVEVDVLTPPGDAEPFVPPTFAPPAQRTPWLAEAIRAVAQRRDATLAAELIAELLPAQGLMIGQPLTYEVSIEELGAFVVRTGNGVAMVSRPFGFGGERFDFRLAGSAVALAPLAAGAVPGSRLRGVHVRGNRRKARRLLKAARRPLALADLARAGIPVWPGLLLPALAEAIDPQWTAGSRFAVAYVIHGTPTTAIYVQVGDGGPITVSARLEPGLAPTSTVHLSERACLAMVAGIAVPAGDHATLSDDEDSSVSLLRWFAQAQGLIAAPFT